MASATGLRRRPANEDSTVRIDSGEDSPVLGDSFDNIARYGLSFQRSQNGGRFTPSQGPNFGYYKQAGGKERLNVDTQDFTQSLSERADEIESERAEPEPPDDYEGRWESSDSAVDDVQGMFDGLESDLRDSRVTE